MENINETDFARKLDILSNEILPGLNLVHERLMALANRIGYLMPLSEKDSQEPEPVQYLDRLGRSIALLREHSENMHGLFNELEQLA